MGKLTKEFLSKIIKEELNKFLSERSEAAEDAAHYGLTYAGFGRWKNSSIRQVKFGF